MSRPRPCHRAAVALPHNHRMENWFSPELLALIREAESLHGALGEARARSQKLIAALRRQRKQARLMTATLNTLRQLKLQEVAE